LVIVVVLIAKHGRTSTMVEVKRFSVGEVAARAGVATSALRFYETHGLIVSERNDSGHRRYRADVLRRVAFIRVAQQIGLSLSEISAALASLPARRTPTRQDWSKLSRRWLPRIDEQIVALELLRDRLDGCIGCGCLSLDTCELYNLDDRAARRGAGARYLLGDPIET
jgi:MerR family transcriptional regulator, redox-sensitive transcriptional activator SoxR